MTMPLPEGEGPEWRTHLTVTAVPSAPLSLDPAVIAKNRDAWVERWTSIVLR